jgi:selenocysteine lyase/cysteine desulfurase
MPYHAKKMTLWHMHRTHFPITESCIYLHHAGVAPLCRPAADAMIALTQDVLLQGSVHYDRWLAAYEGLRTSAARLIHASPREIAIVKNTSEGISTFALGLDWKAGDRIVSFEGEFPANALPWLRLQSRGVRITALPMDSPLERIDEAVRGARLLAISWVQYLSGYRADLTALGEICSRHGCLFFVDAIQGLGVFSIDVERDRIHALAADGHKWLLGPEGCGVLYIQRDLQDSIEPVEFGWTNVAKYADYTTRDATLRPDAGRYECGTLNTVGAFGLRAAIDFLLGIDSAAIIQAVLAHSHALAEGGLRKGYEILGPRAHGHTSGIVSMRKPGMESAYIVRLLKDRGMIAAPRQGWIRFSPHFYISPDEIQSVVEALP